VAENIYILKSQFTYHNDITREVTFGAFDSEEKAERALDFFMHAYKSERYPATRSWSISKIKLNKIFLDSEDIPMIEEEMA